MRYPALLQILFIIFLAVMAGCGRKGDPRPPESIVSAEELIIQNAKFSGRVGIARIIQSKEECG